ncbi:hypothetical protein AMECASPLE_035339 [Ameca splendens]|uniref:Uncharacterized protein n=1 Tax=Ameca splendens TaxID=208324 RepID=A0ABV1AED6_9TELE
MDQLLTYQHMDIEPKLTDQATRALIREAAKSNHGIWRSCRAPPFWGESVYKTTIICVLRRPGLYGRAARFQIKPLLKETTKHVGTQQTCSGLMKPKLNLLALMPNDRHRKASQSSREDE